MMFCCSFLCTLCSVPPTNGTANQGKEATQEDEENPIPLPSSLSRPRSHPDMRHIGTAASGSISVPALYSDNEVGDEFDDDIVQELRECTGHAGSSHSTFRMASKELSSSSGFSSPSIPDPPPPPRCKYFPTFPRGKSTYIPITRDNTNF